MQENQASQKAEKEEQQLSRVQLGNIHDYKRLVNNYKNELAGLISEGTMSEEVAGKLFNDFSYSLFNQVVQISIG